MMHDNSTRVSFSEARLVIADVVASQELIEMMENVLFINLGEYW